MGEMGSIAMATAVGLLVSGAMGIVANTTVKTLKTVKKLEVTVGSIVQANQLVADTSVKTTGALRCVIRALRSTSFALRELGANGSVTKALEHVDSGEDIINGQADANALAALAAECREEDM